jgi:hypothetical protein
MLYFTTSAEGKGKSFSRKNDQVTDPCVHSFSKSQVTPIISLCDLIVYFFGR